jgi:hypothetical protein
MLTFLEVQNLLDQAVGPGPIGAHRAFWRGTTRDEFIVKSIFGYPLVAVGDAPSSNLIKALRGQPPFGSDSGTQGATMRRMPAGRPAMAPADIDTIAEWIDGGCPT